MRTTTNTNTRSTQLTNPNERVRDSGEIAPVLLTVVEAARALAVGRTTLYELIRSGDLEAIRIGRSTRIPVDAIGTFVERQRRATVRQRLGAPRPSQRA
jgi:excisionase family DNA binding protein